MTQAIRQRHRALQRAERHPLTPKTRILLGVTGGIAAYKSPDLVRRLIERGAEVQVVMTEAARKIRDAHDASRRCRAAPSAAICGTARRRPPWATSSSRAGRSSC